MLNNEIKTRLKAVNRDEQALIITVGNSLRGDDAVGPYIAENLPFVKEGFIVINAMDKPENIVMDLPDIKPSITIIIDAANFGGTAGEARLFNIESVPETTLSTHTFPLPILAGILRKDLNSEVKFLGIQACTFEFGGTISDSVKATADEIITYIRENRAE